MKFQDKYQEVDRFKDNSLNDALVTVNTLQMGGLPYQADSQPQQVCLVKSSKLRFVGKRETGAHKVLFPLDNSYRDMHLH